MKAVEQRSLGTWAFPWVVRRFVEKFKRFFVVLDESSLIKTTSAMKESKKSTRSRIIKMFNQTDSDRCIMTGTLMSKSPLNLYDQFDFLKRGFFEEGMFAMADRYCIQTTMHAARGRRITISQKDYAAIRAALVRAWERGGERSLYFTYETVQNKYGVSPSRQQHIMEHRRYSPFIKQEELMERIAPCTEFVKREDIFDIANDRFVLDPIRRPVQISEKAKKIANQMIELGFTDKMTLGKVPALELLIRLQDVCNGFEPAKDADGQVELHPFSENPKIDALLGLLDEIDAESNQVVIWSSRTALLRLIAEKMPVSYVVYDGSATAEERTEAEKKFMAGEVQAFIANQSVGAYGLNCLAACNYAVYMCVDGSVEKYHQSMHRILRGELKAPKFAYSIYAEGSVEERQWNALRLGQDLIGADNRKEKFLFR
jgi:SNF2 family DNA or RNA helicase